MVLVALALNPLGEFQCPGWRVAHVGCQCKSSGGYREVQVLVALPDSHSHQGQSREQQGACKLWVDCFHEFFGYVRCCDTYVNRVAQSLPQTSDCHMIVTGFSESLSPTSQASQRLPMVRGPRN